jgi:glycosyltransferase involved in cell wall biosynthesis
VQLDSLSRRTNASNRLRPPSANMAAGDRCDLCSGTMSANRQRDMVESNLTADKQGAIDRCIERSDKPKLLIASRIFGASGQPWLWRQVVGLRGFQKELLCWERHNPETQPTAGISVQVLAGDPGPYDSAGRWLYRLRNLPGRNFYAAIGQERRELTELLRRERPALILCNFGDIAMRLLPVALGEGVPVVAYFHGDFLFVSNRWYRWSLGRCLRQLAAIVVVTQAERQWMLEHGASKDRVYVIPCGAPTDIFRPGVRKSGAVRFVMASRLANEKGCDLSIKAFAALAADVPGAELQIYGDGPARGDLQNLVDVLGLTERVFFHGYVDERRLAEALPSCDVFIQHSLRKEGSPVSIVEAMACGLPVVATPVGGITDQVVEGKTGLLVAERDVRGMAAAMRRLACNSELRMSFGHAGRQRAVEMNDSSLQTRRLEQVLRAARANPRASTL